MKILILHSSFEIFGGAETFIFNLKEALLSDGHEVIILSGDDFSIKQKKSNDIVLSRWFFQISDIFGSSNKKIVKRVNEIAPDTILLNNWARLRSSTILKISKRYFVFHTVHDYFICDPKATAEREYNLFVRLILFFRVRIILNKFRNIYFHFPALRTKNIFANRSANNFQNFVIFPLSPFLEVPKSIRYSEKPRRIGYLGGLYPHKGILEFVESFQNFENNPFNLIIAGDGIQAETIRRISSKNPNIEYVGQLTNDQKIEYFDKIDFLVCPSNCRENFSLSCAESLSYGKPILASKIAEPAMGILGSYILFGSNSEFTDVRLLLEHLVKMDKSQYKIMCDLALESGILMAPEIFMEKFYSAIRYR